MTIELYEFQAEDERKLIDQRGRAILSEMGTGKTPLAAHMLRETIPSKGQALVVAPMQTLQQWERWLNEVDINTIVVDPKNREWSWQQYQRMKDSQQGSAFLVHWEALRLMPQLAQTLWHERICDEVQKAQNRKAQQTRAIKKIKSTFVNGLSGTPVTSAIDKYWSTLNLLYPREWTTYWGYFKNYVDYEVVYPQGFQKVKGPRLDTLPDLLAKVEPFTVRHLKKEQCCPHHPLGVMPYLPDKYSTKILVDLDPQQRRAYEQMRKEMIAWVGAHELEPVIAPIVVAQLTRLQQFACAYATVDENNHVQLTEPSSKLDAVMEVLEDNPTESIVVFSRFNQLIRLLSARLQRAGIDYVTYTGENRGTREEDKARFLDGSARVFVGNIAAGGVGLDGLQTVSSTVIFTDRIPGSPALNGQAEDRLWRDGQLNAVQVIDIQARNTLDPGTESQLQLKWSWIKQLLGDQ